MPFLRILFALVLLTLPTIADPQNRNVPLGYQQISAATLVSATTLTVPTGATVAYIIVSATSGNAASVNYRDDGTNPTSTTGNTLGLGQQLIYTGSLGIISFIVNTGSPILNVSYYR